MEDGRARPVSGSVSRHREIPHSNQMGHLDCPSGKAQGRVRAWSHLAVLELSTDKAVCVPHRPSSRRPA